MPEAPAVDGGPLCPLDKHTALGKVAIHRLARESQPGRDVLRAFAPEGRASAVAAIAAFYADAAPVSQRLIWEGAAALEALGVEANMQRAGASADGIEPILAAVRDNLGHLNWLRVRGLGRRQTRWSHRVAAVQLPKSSLQAAGSFAAKQHRDIELHGYLLFLQHQLTSLFD
jgi:hypothetical protein